MDLLMAAEDTPSNLAALEKLPFFTTVLKIFSWFGIIDGPSKKK
tara:strand:- start:307 stop:438 length:132 start_codon:yes stop_codon:yes gene_type:complete